MSDTDNKNETISSTTNNYKEDLPLLKTDAGGFSESSSFNKNDKVKDKTTQEYFNDILYFDPTSGIDSNCPTKVKDAYIYRIPNRSGDIQKSQSILIVSETEQWCRKCNAEVRLHSSSNHHFKPHYIESEIKSWTRHQKPIHNPPSDDHSYKDMKNGVNGPFLIFNYEHFESNSCREGASEMALKIAKTAIYLGFSPVRIYNDLKKSQTTSLLERISKSSFHGINCFGCYVSSHGDKDGHYYYRRDSDPIQGFEHDIGGINCGGSCKAPRLFFYDMCLGVKTEKQKRTYGLTNVQKDMIPIAKYFMSTSVPVSADILSIFSTTPGCVSYRESFNYALCETLTEYCDKELAEIIRKINNKMSEFGFPAADGDGDTKQMPTPIYKMRKNFYFYPR